MIHTVVDIDRWIAQFPLEQLQADPTWGRWIGGAQISGPYDIAVVEQIRRKVAADHDLGPSVPTDVLVFALGEPPGDTPFITKIGGTPYRPADQPWPATAKGAPLTFVAQVCFADSRDIVPELPGDLLLIFAEEEDYEDLRFEWQPLRIPQPMKSDDVPKPGWPFVCCHGHVHRTVDYPTVETYPPDAGPFGGFQQPYLLPCIAGTKIGGAPAFIQESTTLPGTPLAVLGSVGPRPDTPFPWINRAQPIPLYPPEDENQSVSPAEAFGAVLESIRSLGSAKESDEGQARWPQSDLLKSAMERAREMQSRAFSIGDAGAIYLGVDDDGRTIHYASDYY